MPSHFVHNHVTIDLKKAKYEFKDLLKSGMELVELTVKGRYATFETYKNLNFLWEGWANEPFEVILDNLHTRNAISVTLLEEGWSNQSSSHEEDEQNRNIYQSWWEGVCAAWEVSKF